VLATPFLPTLSVLSNDNSKVHACPSIAYLARLTKFQHSLANFVAPLMMRFRGRGNFNAARTEPYGLSPQLVAQSHQKNCRCKR